MPGAEALPGVWASQRMDAGLLRTGSALEAAARELADRRAAAPDARDPFTALEDRSLLDLARLLTLSPDELVTLTGAPVADVDVDLP